MKELSNQELDLLDELIDEGFARLGLSDIGNPTTGQRLNKAGWLVNLKYRVLEDRNRRHRDGTYPLFPVKENP